MWRRTYLFLILVRLYFALSPSYLHPDENFQGPEVIAGRIYGYPVHETWEFTSTNPIRSTFPLWLVYGLPMYTLKALWIKSAGIHDPWSDVPPAIVFYMLRALMFVLSFVLEDWAIQELVTRPKERRVALLLVASSYVTWTWQCHTFSNAVETLVVLWGLVLVQRIAEDKEHTGVLASAVLGFVTVLGTFNRITFPAFLLIPGLSLIPHFRRKPFSVVSILLFGTLTAAIGVYLDTRFYSLEPITLETLRNSPVFTPLNNILYNSQHTNLAEHGIHPFYQHLVTNLPQLLGPSFPLLIFSYQKTIRLAAALCGVLVLSFFPHQEARFLIPAVPLILSSIRLPRSSPRLWIGTWVVFNAALGILMGAFHQGGIVPMQTYIADHAGRDFDVKQVFWWKTYSPPTWLLNGLNENITTTDLMGIKGDAMVARLVEAAPCYASSSANGSTVYLAAPDSATFLDAFVPGNSSELGDGKIRLQEVWHYSKHLNLDDMDFGDDGVGPTLRRVVGRRGLVLWRVTKECRARDAEIYERLAVGRAELNL